jgi:DNA-binding MarR family transcriptional regulator
MSNFPVDGSRRRASRDRLVERFMELVPTVRRAFDVRPGPGERAEWLSLTRHQLEALAALQEGGLTMRCLCERLDISESAGTALSDRLVARGMVARETDPADRRVVRLVLTGEARAMVERYHQMKRTRIAELLSALRRDDLERLVHIYEALASASSPAGDGEPGEPPSPHVPARARRGAARRARRAPESDTTTAGASS